MVCPYCLSNTDVVNSRPQKRANAVWRRRKCQNCTAVFSTTESIDLTQAVSVRRTISLEPFARDVLLLSIHDSLRHRPTAATDATGITNTIITRLLPAKNATIDREHIVAMSMDVLEHFDRTAWTHYCAFHPLHS